jgi:hypothetical protein
MNNSADHHMIGFFSIKNIVRLKAKAPVARGKLVGTAPNPGKISQETESVLEAGMVGLGLVSAEARLSKPINIDEIRSSPNREPIY